MAAGTRFRLSGSHIVHFVGHGHLDETPAAGQREAALFLERDDGDQFDPVTGADLVEQVGRRRGRTVARLPVGV